MYYRKSLKYIISIYYHPVYIINLLGFETYF